MDTHAQQGKRRRTRSRALRTGQASLSRRPGWARQKRGPHRPPGALLDRQIHGRMPLLKPQSNARTSPVAGGQRRVGRLPAVRQEFIELAHRPRRDPRQHVLEIRKRIHQIHAVPLARGHQAGRHRPGPPPPSFPRKRESTTRRTLPVTPARGKAQRGRPRAGGGATGGCPGRESGPPLRRGHPRGRQLRVTAGRCGPSGPPLSRG